VLLPAAASAWLIQSKNGFMATDWVAHSFYNGDTATFVALVQRSLTTTGLVEANPFAGNGPLEYPTLLHAGVADMLVSLGLGAGWLYFLPVMVFGQIVLTVPLFFLLRDAVKDLPGWRHGYRWGWRGLLLEAAVIIYVMAVSWESYVYPQGHFFTTALFLLLAALLARAWSQRGTAQYAWTATGLVVTGVLLLSNAVTGVAALVTWSVFAGLRWTDTERSQRERTGYGLSIVGLAILFIAMAPGDGGLQLLPHFSYTAAQNMLMLAVPLILVLGAVFQQLRQQSFIGLSTIALGALAIITFVFSDRNIVIDNAARFFYHALLVGWPLAVDGLVRGARLLQARWRQLQGWPLQFGACLGLALGAGILLLPAGASLASVHDHLLFKDVHVSPIAARAAMDWITANTAPEAVFLASPNEPWEIPLFTGRALLRTNYWLSPDDELQKKVNQAFAGDPAAQAEAIAHVQYVVLKSADVEAWSLPEESRVYDVGGVQVYAVGN
jgi:hypothetical protein